MGDYGFNKYIYIKLLINQLNKILPVELTNKIEDMICIKKINGNIKYL